MKAVKRLRGGACITHACPIDKMLSIKSMAPPSELVIPLLQHAGKPALPLVKAGDHVRMGQKIGEADGIFSANVHASAAGFVKSVEHRDNTCGLPVLSVVLEYGGDEWCGSLKAGSRLSELTPAQIVDIVHDAGIVGMGGAGFPTHVKLTIPEHKKIDTVILNGAECEPYLASDYSLMTSMPEKVLYGLRAVMKAVGAENAVAGIEDDKPHAIAAMMDAAGNNERILIRPVKTKYPQGAEKSLIYSLTHREVPAPGLPMDIGLVVVNAATAKAISDAITTGMPLISRIVTVAGAVKNPSNLAVRIGTPISELIQACGGFTGKPVKVLAGGPMMGVAQSDLNAPVMKGTTGVVVLDETLSNDMGEQNCMRCGRCLSICPLHLMPREIEAASISGDWAKAQDYDAMNCFECGLCSYICPAHRQLTQYIRQAKYEIRNKGQRGTL